MLRINEAARVVVAHQQASLITEALDQNDLQRATQIIEKLTKLKGASKVLDQMIQTTIDDVNKFTGASGGNVIDALFKKLKSQTGMNPVVKGLHLVNILEQGFYQLPAIVKNNGVNVTSKTDKNVTLQQAVAQQSKDQNDAQNKVKIIQNMLTGAFKPSGLFGKMGIPKNFDTKQFVTEIMNMKLGTLVEMYNSLIHGMTTKALDNDIVSNVNDGQPQKGALSNDQISSMAEKLAKNTDVSVDDIKTVLNVLNVTGELKPR